MLETLTQWETLAWPLGILAGAVCAGLVGHFLLFSLAQRLARRTEISLDDLVVRHCRAPSRLILPLFAVHLSLPFVRMEPKISGFLGQTLGLLLIGALGWLAVQIAFLVEDLLIRNYEIDAPDNLKARRIRTQIQILRRVVVVGVAVVTVATALMTMDDVRQLGTSILASAGIAGIIVGFAAQRSIATLVAGLQIAVTQPIRIDDVVVVEKEWGRIEEITLTYVVRRIWDLRRLIVPITYFIEKPFENWTRISAELLGTVLLYADYTVPVQAVREELRRIVEASELWDGRVCALQVTGASERTVELRALVSASDSSKAWELRCEVRERLIEFIRRNCPEGLPRTRAEIRLGEREHLDSQSFAAP
jgi:small-conductance mechanosensitive channel